MKRIFLLPTVLALLGVSFAAQANVFNLGDGFTNLETTLVDDAGNIGELSGESAGGVGADRICGAVSYNYNIGKYEVTAKQYVDFLNAKAKTSEPYGLWNADMWNNAKGCKIQRTGTSNNYTYTIASSLANKPVNYVSFWDACRFANWLSNGQGNGDTETGTYTLTASGTFNNTITRNANWNWAVTSEDEWYKAAYYKGDGIDSGYWDYPTSSNLEPGQDLSDASGNNANYCIQGVYPGNRTNVGEFKNSESPYGTFDQGGNLYEWNESIFNFDGQLVNFRGIRGSSFCNYIEELQAASRNYSDIKFESYRIGFRVVQAVPEPSSIIALASGFISLLCITRRRL